jgi:hypothetical protein
VTRRVDAPGNRVIFRAALGELGETSFDAVVGALVIILLLGGPCTQVSLNKSVGIGLGSARL